MLYTWDLGTIINKQIEKYFNYIMFATLTILITMNLWSIDSIDVMNLPIISIGILHNTFWEEFEDTKGVIRIRISKKNKQHNG